MVKTIEDGESNMADLLHGEQVFSAWWRNRSKYEFYLWNWSIVIPGRSCDDALS